MALSSKFLLTSLTFLSSRLQERGPKSLIYYLLPWWQPEAFYTLNNTLSANTYATMLVPFITITRIIDSFIQPNNTLLSNMPSRRQTLQAFTNAKKQLIYCLENLPSSEVSNTPYLGEMLDALRTPKVFIFDESDVYGSTTLHSKSLFLLIVTGTIIIKASGTMHSVQHDIENLLQYPARYTADAHFKWGPEHLYQHIVLEPNYNIRMFVLEYCGMRCDQDLIQTLNALESTNPNQFLIFVYTFYIFTRIHTQTTSTLQSRLEMLPEKPDRDPRQSFFYDYNPMVKRIAETWNHALIHIFSEDPRLPVHFYDHLSTKLLYLPGELEYPRSFFALHLQKLPPLTYHILSQAFKAYNLENFPKEIAECIASHLPRREIPITQITKYHNTETKEIISAAGDQTRGLNITNLECIFNIGYVPHDYTNFMQSTLRLCRDHAPPLLGRRIIDYIPTLSKQTLLSETFFTALTQLFDQSTLLFIEHTDKHNPIPLDQVILTPPAQQRLELLRSVLDHKAPLLAYVNGNVSYAHSSYIIAYFASQQALFSSQRTPSSVVDTIYTSYKKLTDALKMPLKSFIAFQQHSTDLTALYEKWKNYLAEIWTLQNDIDSSCSQAHQDIIKMLEATPTKPAPLPKRKNTFQQKHEQPKTPPVLRLSHYLTQDQRLESKLHILNVLREAQRQFSQYHSQLEALLSEDTHLTGISTASLFSILGGIVADISVIGFLSKERSMSLHKVYALCQTLIAKTSHTDPLHIVCLELSSIWHHIVWRCEPYQPKEVVASTVDDSFGIRLSYFTSHEGNHLNGPAPSSSDAKRPSPPILLRGGSSKKPKNKPSDQPGPSSSTITSSQSHPPTP